MQGAGMDRYAAHTLRGQLFGAQGDKGRGIGVADFVPGLDTSAAADDYRANPGLLTGAGVGLSMLPLVGGALLLTLGLVLDALAAWWLHELRRWLLTSAALIVVYLALVAAALEPMPALLVALVGALAFCVGHGLHAGRATAAFGAIGELVEKTLQILINTLSFARVGAFALAHAGLSSAIVALMDAADGSLAKALVLVLGNLLVIVLEVMVVSIQTTRLVLFEFFTRFLEAQGRVFRPLPPPPSTLQES